MSAAPTNRTLRVIKYAMLGGIVTFGVVILVLGSLGVLPEPVLDGTRSPVAIVLSVMVLGTIGAVPVLNSRIAAATDAARRFQLSILLLALAEAAALAGGVLWFLSGSWTMYGVGVVIFVVAMSRAAMPEGEPDAS